MIRFLIFGSLLLGISFRLIAQPQMSNFRQVPEGEVGLFQKIELRFHLNEYANNYDSKIIRVDAEFRSPSGKIYIMPGFYFTDYVKLPDFDCGMDIPCEKLKSSTQQPYNWAIRFTPTEVGTWTYTVYAKDKKGSISFPENRSFTCVASDETGFISKNNNRYLKKGDEPVFMVGANVPWYGKSSFYDIPLNELGTNDYKRYIKLLAQNNATFMKVWINHPPGMALVGREFTTGKMHWFDDYNQKDAWQLDRIFEEAQENNINILLCVFQQNSLVNNYGVYYWKNDNAFNSAENSKGERVIRSPFDFFSNKKAIKYTKDLLRYIIARWGYAPNLIAWKLFTEVEQVENIWSRSNVYPPLNYLDNMIRWHSIMAGFIRQNDPYKHLITTSSPNKYAHNGKEFPSVFYDMDLTVSHDYKSYKSIVRMKQFETHMLKAATNYIETPRLTDKPYMSQEWGFSTGKEMVKYDPNGYEFHCCLWSSSMSGAFGSMAPWWWDSYLLKKHLFKELQPVSFFMNSVVEHLNGSTKGYKVQIHGLTVFYATTEKEDIFIGWCQDDNYDFSVVKNTRYIKNLKSSKPRPAGRKSIIKLRVNKNKQTYTIRWYDTQNAEMVQEETVSSKGYKIKFTMPQDLRTSTFGDGAFIITTGKPTVRTEESSTGTASKHIKL